MEKNLFPASFCVVKMRIAWYKSDRLCCKKQIEQDQNYDKSDYSIILHTSQIEKLLLAVATRRERWVAFTMLLHERLGAVITPTPYTLHPTLCTLHPAPYTLHPTPYTLHPAPHTLNPNPQTLQPTPCTLNPKP